MHNFSFLWLKCLLSYFSACNGALVKMWMSLILREEIKVYTNEDLFGCFLTFKISDQAMTRLFLIFSWHSWLDPSLRILYHFVAGAHFTSLYSTNCDCFSLFFAAFALSSRYDFHVNEWFIRRHKIMVIGLKLGHPVVRVLLSHGFPLQGSSKVVVTCLEVSASKVNTWSRTLS